MIEPLAEYTASSKRETPLVEDFSQVVKLATIATCMGWRKRGVSRVNVYLENGVLILEGHVDLCRCSTVSREGWKTRMAYQSGRSKIWTTVDTGDRRVYKPQRKDRIRIIQGNRKNCAVERSCKCLLGISL